MASEALKVVWPDGVVGVKQLGILEELHTLQHHRHVSCGRRGDKGAEGNGVLAELR